MTLLRDHSILLHYITIPCKPTGISPMTTKIKIYVFVSTLPSRPCLVSTFQITWAKHILKAWNDNDYQIWSIRCWSQLSTSRTDIGKSVSVESSPKLDEAISSINTLNEPSESFIFFFSYCELCVCCVWLLENELSLCWKFVSSIFSSIVFFLLLRVFYIMSEGILHDIKKCCSCFSISFRKIIIWRQKILDYKYQTF